MPSVRLAAAVLLAVLSLTPHSHAAEHACSGDATARARKLLRFHAADADAMTIADGASARVVPQVHALRGGGLLDVLEVTSHIYKADYRMRFIYARGKDAACTLMGQEILEASNPY